MILAGKSTTLTCNSLMELDKIAENILCFAEDIKVWAFFGEMGAGKTTLIKAICAKKGVKENVSSPTFSLVNEYQNNKGEMFYHFDFYRINNELEALNIGCEEYFYSGNYCFIEWPSKIDNLIPEHFLKVIITESEHESCRNIELIKS